MNADSNTMKTISSDGSSKPTNIAKQYTVEYTITEDGSIYVLKIDINDEKRKSDILDSKDAIKVYDGIKKSKVSNISGSNLQTIIAKKSIPEVDIVKDNSETSNIETPSIVQPESSSDTSLSDNNTEKEPKDVQSTEENDLKSEGTQPIHDNSSFNSYEKQLKDIESDIKEYEDFIENWKNERKAYDINDNNSITENETKQKEEYKKLRETIQRNIQAIDDKLEQNTEISEDEKNNFIEEIRKLQKKLNDVDINDYVKENVDEVPLKEDEVGNPMHVSSNESTNMIQTTLPQEVESEIATKIQEPEKPSLIESQQSNPSESQGDDSTQNESSALLKDTITSNSKPEADSIATTKSPMHEGGYDSTKIFLPKHTRKHKISRKSKPQRRSHTLRTYHK
jgi:hypothetical protein